MNHFSRIYNKSKMEIQTRVIRRCYTRFFREDEHKLLLREQCVRVRARLTTFEIQGSSVLLWKILRSAVDDLWSTICRNALSLQGSCEHNGELAIRKEDESKVCKAGYCYARWYCKHLLILISFICLFHLLAILLSRLFLSSNCVLINHFVK